MLDLKAVKVSLEGKLSELLERELEIEKVLSDPGDSDSEERAVEMENDETLSAVGNVTKAEIRDIKLAIHRIETGQYASCIRCGKQISKDRLAALPWTSKCVNCA